MRKRHVVAVYPARPTKDGDGVKIRRLAMAGNARLDPFLMLDELGSDDSADYIGGFPEHPHRGFETVTLMLDGRMRHRDSLGNEGVIGPGDVQWMSAARGIVHSEMPEQRDGRLHGFQLWVNLPARLKLADPRYRDIAAADIPTITAPGGAKLRIISGEVDGVTGPVREVPTQPLLLDVAMDADDNVQVPVWQTATALVYVYKGELSAPAAGGERRVAEGELAVLENGDALSLRGMADGSRALVLAAQPIGEPVAHYGPFVMNSRDEIDQAIADYREGRLTA